VTAVPQAAIDAAAEVLHDEQCGDGDTTATCPRWQAALGRRGVNPEPHLNHISYYQDRAREVLEAAAPHIAAAERERIAQLAEKHRVRYGAYVAINGKQTSGLREFADLIRTEGDQP
jgi:hypothetical protein